MTQRKPRSRLTPRYSQPMNLKQIAGLKTLVASGRDPHAAAVCTNECLRHRLYNKPASGILRTHPLSEKRVADMQPGAIGKTCD